MTPFAEHPLSSAFLGQLLEGMATNYEIAALALLIGLAVGLPLAQANVAGGMPKALSGAVVSIMRAAPTFVVMFFLMNSIPRHAALFGYPIAPTGWLVVAISLVPYAAAYVADNGTEALKNLQRGSLSNALLFLPNMMRAFFVLVMASSAGAAVGVTEAVAVILRQTQSLEALHQKLLLFAVGVFCFGVPLQTGFVLVNALYRRLKLVAVRNSSGWADAGRVDGTAATAVRRMTLR
jgi:ABC-type arginine/histidine transport system permease subunit